jgi:acyl-CoA reductase-like NAD-dependent aldehyde dehydrogenase
VIAYLNCMESYLIYCGGEFIKTAKSHPVTNKYTGDVFAGTWMAGEKELDRALEAAMAARRPCAEMSSLERSDCLRKIHDSLSSEKEKFARLLATESAKPMRFARVEIERAINCFLIASEECKRLPREYLMLDWTKNGKNREGLVRYVPAGVVAGISPFNFPMNLAVHKIAPAIAAGCPIVLKPASTTPLSTLALAQIIHASGLPPGAVSVLPMDRETGNLLVTDERPALLSFTGSPVVGWELKKQSGKKKTVLELGGNAAVIICEDADLNEIVSKCVTGAFSYSGQICIHAQRFYVHPAKYDQFIDMMAAEARKLKTGDPLDESTWLSTMIDEENAKRVSAWVGESVISGAKTVLAGGREGSFHGPVILTDTNTSMKVNAEEVFGPVICIEKYNGKIEDAVNKTNDTRFGLQCGVFTDRVSELDHAFSHLEVGGVIHNDVPSLRFDHMPYGGVKDSGLGREGIGYAIRDMLEPRVLVR